MRGWLHARVRQEQDRRVVLFTLTPQGPRTLGRMLSEWARILERVLMRLPEEDIHELAMTLNRLAIGMRGDAAVAGDGE